ncbi:hypothetical protein GDO86_018003 [Hymenochirus boettgeri]|uniref:UPAR/Ly6 domain-containing protein n=1 Tax=Hymenochirus boettgeri TaxID=247094 RepID=A0A8T2IM49_9PIPI|nr:hypothetical protein GDO86_018003 [Hymenochirus boettgeri]
MAALNLVLMVTAFCIGTVYSLQCYTCSSQTLNTNCMNQTNCSSTANYCQTNVSSLYSVSVIDKSCAATCSPTSFSLTFISYSVSCCSNNLCNVSGSTSIKYSSILLALSLGFIVWLLDDQLPL